jgi:RNA polymerase sigma-70 factor (ECF subfamily)
VTTQGVPLANERRARFESLWRSFAPRVQAYATRHVGPLVAQEIVAETFTVAWRRIDDVPSDALPWLLVVARNTISNQRRANNRALQLSDELAALERVAASAEAADVSVIARTEVLAALAALSSVEREALLLVAWDGLSTSEAAAAAGCSVTALKVRLHRARRRLRALDSAHPGRMTSDAPERPESMKGALA